MATPDLELHGSTTADPTLRAEEAGRLRLLVEASATLLGSLRREDVLPRVLELAQRTLEADAYSLWQRDDETGVWTVAAYEGLSKEYVEASTLAIVGNEDEVSLEKPI